MRRNHYRPVMPDPHPPLVSRSEELRHRREKNGELLSRFREAAPSPPWEIDTMIPRYFTGVRVSLPEYPKPKHPIYTLELDLPFSPDGPDLSVTVQRDVTTYHLIFRPEPEAPDMVSFTAGLITSGALDDLTERNEP